MYKRKEENNQDNLFCASCLLQQTSQ